MENLLYRLQSKLKKNARCMLVTVLSQRGSAPRGAGAALFIDESGCSVGTVGGGALEALALRKAEECLKERKSLLLPLDLTADVHMSCGGAVVLLFQYVDAPLPLPEPGAQGWLLTEIEPDGAWTARFQSLPGGWPNRAEFDGRTFSCPIGQKMRVWIFGAGHVAQALAPLLEQLDFRCGVLDDRAEFANRERFPTVDAVDTIDLSHLEALPVSESDAVCIMTRGHQSDYVVLRQMLRTRAGYLGLMGSLRKVAETRRHLLDDGFPEDAIARIHMPIGTDISADTPMEIAVSVAGELIQHRARVQGRAKKRHGV